jgi:hypothetical protein
MIRDPAAVPTFIADKAPWDELPKDGLARYEAGKTD